MSKTKITTETEGLRPEYKREDLGKGVRGKYLSSYRKGTNVVLLEPDVAAAFPTPEAVNTALHALMAAAKGTVRLTRPSTRSVRKRAA
jgi:hypothetical protein